MGRKDENTYGKRSKLFLIFLFSLLLTLILVIIARTPSAHDYELDIYSAYPWYFWALIFNTSALGCVLILWSRSKELITYGYIFIVITNVVLLGLQFFRGYFFYGGGDTFTHVGYVKDILRSGHISSYNFYPFQHLLVIDLNLATSLSIEISYMILTIIFYVLFVVSLYVFLRRYTLPKFRYCLVFGTLLIFGTTYTSPLPNILSFLFFPLVLFLLVKLTESPYKLRLNILLFIVVLSVIFFHPITSLYLLGILVLFRLTNTITFEIWNKRYSPDYLDITIFSSTAAWMSWHLGFSSIRRGINRTLYSILFDPSLNPRAEDYTQTLGMFDIHVLDILRKFIFDFGIVTILCLVIIGYFIYMSCRKGKVSRFLKQREVLFLGVSTFIFVAWSTVNFFADFVSFTRVFKLVILFSFILIGFIFSFNTTFQVNYDIKNKNIHYGVLSLLVVFILVISVLGVYPSPISFSSNRQVTQQENQGMNWFFEVQNDERRIWEEGIRQHRWADFVHGREGEDRPGNIRREPNVKDHFGYAEHERMGENYSGYFIKTEIHIITYREIFLDYKEYWRFDESSYKRFSEDDSVNKIYDSGFFTCYDIEEVE